MNNPEQPNIKTVEGEKEWESLNAHRVAFDAYFEKAQLTEPKIIAGWRKNMSERLQSLGLPETATVADYVKASTQDVEKRMKDLKSGQL